MKTCFGTIYPDLEQFQFGKSIAGRVFQIRVDSVGPGQRDRKLDVDEEVWGECRQCGDFQNCFGFATARLHMQRVLLDF
jgi:hypothetical protein